MLLLPTNLACVAEFADKADSGAGKTAFARLLAEKVHDAGQRFCAIDLKNDWWGLKSNAKGDAAGIPVIIFGGPRADVKLFDDAGATVAETVAAIDQSVILDLDSMSRRKQEIFLAAFLDRLYDVNRRAFLLFCDEADRYAPQKPMTQEAIMSLSSAEDIARRGRKRGIGSFWMTQRTAVLNKNVSEFLNLLVVFRTPGSKDLDELEDRVGRVADKATVKEVVKQAPGLADGQAFFLSSHPALRKYIPKDLKPIQLPLPWTFDSSATPTVGQRRREPKVLAKADLAAIEEKMAAQVERSKADDPRELRKQIADLKRQLAAKPAEKAIDKEALTDAHAKGYIRGAESERQEWYLWLGQHMTWFDEKKTEIGELRRKIGLKKPTSPLHPKGEVPVANSHKDAPPKHFSDTRCIPPAPKPRPISSPDANGHAADAVDRLPEGERKILTAAAQNPNGADRVQISVLTTYKRSTRDKYLQFLQAKGYIVDDGRTIRATQAGIEALGDFEPLPTGTALQEHWLRELPAGEAAILRVLIQNHPNAVDREVISEATNFKRSTRDKYIQFLEARKLVVSGRGEVTASNELFD